MILYLKTSKNTIDNRLSIDEYANPSYTGFGRIWR